MKALVWPVAMGGCEAWTLMKKEKIGLYLSLQEQVYEKKLLMI